ncbi:FHA domain-containing protein [Solirubrobacter soli]|uniref:FHA domain-containing protein n=1 Tax=Solirubrobacter soli TaxID=363832 RepID=UPI0004027479|nr:FHA domain-containing protein [Solirubrobacter soli]
MSFLLYRDDIGEQRVFELDDERERVTIGRRPANDVALPWDAEVSRVHAELAHMGGDWVVCDEGVSHNGTFVNGQRVRGRRRLRGGDVVSVGDTQLTFCAPGGGSTVATTLAREPVPAVAVTPAQRRVLEALCRPLQDGGYAAPASNQQIADELVLAVETVKGTLKALFERFGLEHLPQNQKRAALARAFLDQR